MSDIRIVELTVPAAEGAAGWDELTEAVALHNAVQREMLGTDEFDATPQQAMALLHDQRDTVRRHLLARQGDRLVGTAELEHDRGHAAAWVNVLVNPEDRGRGIGRALADAVTSLARDDGASLLHAVHETTDLDSQPRLPAPTGYGDVPADARSTRFLQQQGFTLAQVELVSALELPVPGSLLERLSDATRDSSEYELISWVGPVPEEVIEQFARLRMIMSTAAPAGELTEEEQVWDADRVHRRDRRNVEAGNVSIETAARHRASGELVAFTSLSYPAAADGRAVGQGYTLVVPEHRGHSLGMRIKINNLRLLADHDHGARRVVTGNAGENDAMLSINRALGFRPDYVAGWWQSKIS